MTGTSPPTDPVPVNDALAGALVDEWARAGVVHAAVAPGSRSTPMAVALAADARIRVEVFLDERSAAFFALGAAKASGRPALVLCTSGTAAANFHPAVVEASHSRVPLLVCTADRPPELRATGAGQTADQVKLYGGDVRWFADVGLLEAGPAADRYWRSLASRAWAAAMGPPAGPVHVNLPFREPLAGGAAGGPGAAEANPPRTGPPWTVTAPRPVLPHPDDVAWLAGEVGAVERGLVVAGWGATGGGAVAAVGDFARAAGWPVLADAVSGLRSGPSAVSTYDPLLRVPGFAASHRPDLVLRLGASPTGRLASEWLDRSVPQVVVDPDGAWLDPQRAATRRIVADPALLLAAVAATVDGERRSPWLDGWLDAEARARGALDAFLDASDEPFEGRVARDLAVALPDGATLVVGSSMPVRDLECFAPPREGLRVLANRGVNGIDGFTSTVLGVAKAVTGPVVGLLGDLTFLHDAGGLLWAARRGVQATMVVVDNDGGGIFSFLPQAAALGADRFEELFGTPHGLDLAAVAASYGVPAVRVRAASDLVPATMDAVAAGGVRLVIVPTDRAANVGRHRQAWAAVAAALTR